MSIEPETCNLDGPIVPAQKFDHTGLPAPEVDGLREPFTTLRDNLGKTSSTASSFVGEPPEVWVRRLEAWEDTHPARPIANDNSRESLYTRPGE